MRNNFASISATVNSIQIFKTANLYILPTAASRKRNCGVEHTLPGQANEKLTENGRGPHCWAALPILWLCNATQDKNRTKSPKVA